jgi:hypothetical protein
MGQGELHAFAGLPQVHNSELRNGMAERRGFVGELFVIMT